MGHVEDESLVYPLVEIGKMCDPHLAMLGDWQV